MTVPSESNTSLCPSTEEKGAKEILDVAALKVQKVYRSYRRRRQFADSTVDVAQELWWHALDFARLNYSTVSFFNDNNLETAAHKLLRVSGHASRIGRGLSTDKKALKLAFQHWIEAVDPRHRYGHNLHYYYEEWCKSNFGQPFFYWLNVGAGRNVDLKLCTRNVLQKQCIKYLGPREREHYEYEPRDGKIVHVETGELLDTTEGLRGEKWIFVMSVHKKLYAGVKKKGLFHHSSFLAGGTTLAAGRLTAENGVLKAVSAHSGHYRPSEENLNVFLTFLGNNGISLKEVEIRATSDDENVEDDKHRVMEGIKKITARFQSVKHDFCSELEVPDEITVEQASAPTEMGDLPKKMKMDNSSEELSQVAFRAQQKFPRMQYSRGLIPRVGQGHTNLVTN